MNRTATAVKKKGREVSRNQRKGAKLSGDSIRAPKGNLKIAQEIARDIVRDIAERRLTVGAALPHEKTMIAQYGVGRASIREALRIIESQGLIYLKPGRNGGPILKGTGPEQMAGFLSLFLRLSNATYGDLADFMLTVSPRLAEAAAANPNRAAVRRAIKLSASNPCGLVEQSDHYGGLDLGPHAVINKLAATPVLSMFADAVDAVFSSHSIAVTKGKDFLDIAERDHVEIAQAVLDGKPAEARELMRHHIERIIEYTTSRVPKFFSQHIDWK